MEIVNETDQTARVRISGGGSGTGPEKGEECEDTSKWPSLPPRGRMSHKPLPPGPWTVYFDVNGRRVVTQTRSDSGKVTLAPAGANFLARAD